MFRRDYILRIIEEFVAMLTQIRGQIDTHQHEQANSGLDHAFQKLLGADPGVIVKMSDTELLAHLTSDGPTIAVREKTYLLVSLLQEEARLHDAGGREEQSRECLVKALDLLMMVQFQEGDFDVPQFAPTIDGLRDQLRDTPLPLSTLAALWRHYERIGAYARAEDALYDLLQAQPDNDELRAEARMFYQRLLRLNDRALEDGNLPRAEVQSALAGLGRK